MPADYQVELTLTTKSLKSGKSGTTVQTFEGDAAFRRAVQRDLLNLQLTWLDAEDAAASNAPAEAATK